MTLKKCQNNIYKYFKDKYISGLDWKKKWNKKLSFRWNKT